jgi:hypothetical protein
MAVVSRKRKRAKDQRPGSEERRSAGEDESSEMANSLRSFEMWVQRLEHRRMRCSEFVAIYVRRADKHG